MARRALVENDRRDIAGEADRLEVGDEAADGARGWRCDSFAGGGRCQGIREVVLGRHGTIDAQLGVPVVDAAAVEGLALPVDKGDFRCHRDAEFAHEIVRVVAKRGEGQLEPRGVLADRVLGLPWIDIHQPELNALVPVGLVQAANLRRVAIGDWTVRCREDKGGGATPGNWLERIDGPAVEIREAGLRLRSGRYDEDRDERATQITQSVHEVSVYKLLTA